MQLHMHTYTHTKKSLQAFISNTNARFMHFYSAKQNKWKETIIKDIATFLFTFLSNIHMAELPKQHSFKRHFIL